MERKARLVSALRELEVQKSEQLRQLEHFSAEQLERPPKEDAWSVAQVILHFAVMEEGMLAYFEKKYGLPDRPGQGLAPAWKYQLMELALASPLRSKAPAVVANIPAEQYPVALSRWETARKRMSEAFLAVPEQDLGRPLFKHPIAGRATLDRAIRFLIAHHNKHRGQIQRTLKHL